MIFFEIGVNYSFRSAVVTNDVMYISLSNIIQIANIVPPSAKYCKLCR